LLAGLLSARLLTVAQLVLVPPGGAVTIAGKVNLAV
jgi:hypothetical protein